MPSTAVVMPLYLSGILILLLSTTDGSFISPPPVSNEMRITATKLLAEIHISRDLAPSRKRRCCCRCCCCCCGPPSCLSCCNNCWNWCSSCCCPTCCGASGYGCRRRRRSVSPPSCGSYPVNKYCIGAQLRQGAAPVGHIPLVRSTSSQRLKARRSQPAVDYSSSVPFASGLLTSSSQRGAHWHGVLKAKRSVGLKYYNNTLTTPNHWVDEEAEAKSGNSASENADGKRRATVVEPKVPRFARYPLFQILSPPSFSPRVNPDLHRATNTAAAYTSPVHPHWDPSVVSPN